MDGLEQSNLEHQLSVLHDQQQSRSEYLKQNWRELSTQELDELMREIQRIRWEMKLIQGEVD